MIRKWLFGLVGLMLIIFSVIDLLTGLNYSNISDLFDDSPSVDEPDFYMENASITQFDDEGNKQHIIKAQRFTHFPSGVTDLIAPDMIFFEQDKQRFVSAQNGKILPVSQENPDEQFLLWGQVQILTNLSEGDPMQVDTEKLTVISAQQFAYTEEPVTIQSTMGTSNAVGMRVFLDQGKVVLGSANNRVYTTIKPELMKP